MKPSPIICKILDLTKESQSFRFGFMDSNQARRVDGRSSTEDSTNNDDHQPPIPTDEIDKICGFEPFSLKNHEKDFRDFLKTKFSKELDSLLQQAISKDDQEAFSSLLNKSTVITEKDWWSRPTRDQALNLGYAEVSIKNVLCYICRNKAMNCARVLLQPGFGVNVNVQIPWHGRLGRRKFVDETTPLKWAAAELNSEFTKLFQSRGARVDESELQIAIAGFRY